MAINETIDAQGAIRVVDEETNKVLGTYGSEDLTKADRMEVVVNGSTRKVVLRGKNDGQNPTGIPLGIVGLKYEEIEAHTTDDTLTRPESGSIHSNQGAGGAVVLTLPAGAGSGVSYEVNLLAAQHLRIKPPSGGRLYGDAAGTYALQAVDKYLTTNTIGGYAKVVALGNDIWMLMGQRGTWAVEA